VCARSVNEVICHGIPDLRPLQTGDIVNLDVSIYHDGMHSDLNETFFVGPVSERAQHLVRVSRECLEKAIALGPRPRPSTIDACLCARVCITHTHRHT
jgi:methionyl aminopeptidase